MIDYEKYRWFYTSSGKLVVGGKNAEQNDELLRKIKQLKENYVVMHTSHPGSPFSIIMEKVGNVTKSDIEECAIFTGCFSRAWKENKRKTEVDIFDSSQLMKDKNMKTGTWKVSGKIKRVSVELKLVLARQKGILRAVPENSAKKYLIKVCPGKNDKKTMANKFAVELDNVSYEELMMALPAGGVRICR